MEERVCVYVPRKMTVSPSSRKDRVSPFGNWSGFVPFQLNSNIDPNSVGSYLNKWMSVQSRSQSSLFFSCVEWVSQQRDDIWRTGPEIVPVPRRSPGCILQPPEAWCVSCCLIDQCKYFILDFAIKWGFVILAVCSHTSRTMSKWHVGIGSWVQKKFKGLDRCGFVKTQKTFFTFNLTEWVKIWFCVCVLEDKEAALVLVSRCEDETVLELPTLRSRERLSLRSSFHWMDPEEHIPTLEYHELTKIHSTQRTEVRKPFKPKDK